MRKIGLGVAVTACIALVAWSYQSFNSSPIDTREAEVHREELSGTSMPSSRRPVERRPVERRPVERRPVERYESRSTMLVEHPEQSILAEEPELSIAMKPLPEDYTPDSGYQAKRAQFEREFPQSDVVTEPGSVTPLEARHRAMRKREILEHNSPPSEADKGNP